LCKLPSIRPADSSEGCRPAREGLNFEINQGATRVKWSSADLCLDAGTGASSLRPPLSRTFPTFPPTPCTPTTLTRNAPPLTPAPSSGQYLTFQPCNRRSPGQQWTLTPAGAITLESQALCVELPPGAGENLDGVWLFECEGDQDQTWIVQ
jgi:hypothetical protein